MSRIDPEILTARKPGRIAEIMGKGYRRILLFGEMGIGKSTLALDLGKAIDKEGETCLCLGADPGSPGSDRQ